MASALPLQTPINHTPRERTDVVINDCERAEVLRALTSETAREIAGTLGEEPATVSNIADAVDTSLQNVQYHLARLSEVDLVEAVDTWYSEKGKEMTVYALTTEELVIQFTGDQ